MIVLMMRVEFDIRGVRSIKEKRQTRLRVIERLHHHYKVSVKEIEKQDSLDFFSHRNCRSTSKRVGSL